MTGPPTLTAALAKRFSTDQSGAFVNGVPGWVSLLEGEVVAIAALTVQGGRITSMDILADRESPGHYLIIAEFAVVDLDVSAAEEAARNNERPETKAWAKKLLEVIEGEPVYHHYDELYRTS